MDKFYMPNYDITNACLEKGIIPTPEDIDKLTELMNGRLDEMGYHKIIEDTVVEYCMERYKESNKE
ncbi:MAG: hypothetical protein ACOCRO_08225 [Halanaerobiales bacterium]